MSSWAAKLLLKTSLGSATGAKMAPSAAQIDAWIVSWATQVVPKRQNGITSDPNWRPNGVLSDPSGARTPKWHHQRPKLTPKWCLQRPKWCQNGIPGGSEWHSSDQYRISQLFWWLFDPILEPFLDLKIDKNITKNQPTNRCQKVWKSMPKSH